MRERERKVKYVSRENKEWRRKRGKEERKETDKKGKGYRKIVGVVAIHAERDRDE